MNDPSGTIVDAIIDSHHPPPCIKAILCLAHYVTEGSMFALSPVHTMRKWIHVTLRMHQYILLLVTNVRY